MGSALAENSELSEQFLREISRAEDQQREQQYEKAVQNNKYYQPDNQLDDEGHRTPSKRLRVPPYYMLMQRKRSYPVLPWLPYSGPEEAIRKRFLIAKRSTQNKLPESKRSPRTTKSVERELSEFFGQPSQRRITADGKHKRSTEPDNEPTHSHPPTAPRSYVTPTLSPISTEAPPQTTTAQDNSTEEVQSTLETTKAENTTSGEQHHHHHHHDHHHQAAQNTSSEESTESHEDKHSQEESDENEEHEEGEEDNEEGDDEEETGKAVTPTDNNNGNEDNNSNDAETKNSHAFPLHLNEGKLVRRHKKSIDWSQYFGLDRKKKSGETHKR